LGHFLYYFFLFPFGRPPFFGKRSRFSLFSNFLINPSPPSGLPVDVARLMAALISSPSSLMNSLYDLISFSLNQFSLETTSSLSRNMGSIPCFYFVSFLFSTLFIKGLQWLWRNGAGLVNYFESAHTEYCNPLSSTCERGGYENLTFFVSSQ
jgi:hypothetical protein